MLRGLADESGWGSAVRQIVLVIVVLGGLLALAAGSAWHVWQEFAGTEIPFHGMVALLLGVGAALLLGMGLMALVFFSHRHGYDDEAGRD